MDYRLVSPPTLVELIDEGFDDIGGDNDAEELAFGRACGLTSRRRPDEA